MFRTSTIQLFNKIIVKRFVSFAQLGVNSKLVSRLGMLNIREATFIQEKALPLQISGQYPVAISSETGSGKTLAYLLPFLNELIENPNQRLVVLTPRKELAFQLDKVLHQLDPDIVSAVLVGQSSKIEQGVFPSVIIGTADPVHNFIHKSFRKNDIEHLTMYQKVITHLVFDEADILLNDPFKNIVMDAMFTMRRANKKLRIIAAGATLPRNGRCTAGGVLESEFDKLTWVEGASQNSVPDNISVEFCEKEGEGEKVQYMRELASRLNGISSLVFVANSKRGEGVVSNLQNCGVKTQLLSQDSTKEERENCIKRVLDNSQICTVCTDIISRGIDTKRVNMVVQYDFPKDVMSFLHRCGRTGRGGKKGEVVCLVTPENILLYSGIKTCGVHNDLSSLYSRKRLLRKRQKKMNETASNDNDNLIPQDIK